MRINIGRALDEALGFLFPNRCHFCGTLLGEGACVCTGCLDRAKPLSGALCGRCGAPLRNAGEEGVGGCPQCRDFDWSFSRNMSIFEFTGMIRDVVHLYKFGGRSSLHRLFADLATAGGSPADRIGGFILEHDCLVPVPLTPLRAAERGFNQSALLAKRIARTLSIPCHVSILKRRGSSPPQSGVRDLHRRVRNVNDRFFLRERTAIAGKTTLLVDDVLTTGATASACAAVMLEGGAREVNLLTIARTVRGDR